MSPEELRGVIVALETKFRKHPKRYLAIDREEGCEFSAGSLPSLDVFSIDRRPLNDDVWIENDSSDERNFDAWKRWAGAAPPDVTRFYISQSIAPAMKYFHPQSEYLGACLLLLDVNVDSQSGPSTTWSILNPDQMTPIDVRHVLQHCFAACNLASEVNFETSSNGFRIVSDKHRLTFHHIHVGYVSSVSMGAPDVAVAFDRHRRVFESCNSRCSETGVRIDCTGDQYAAARATWNKISSGWRVRFDGEYLAGYDPFESTALVDDGEEQCLPLLSWELNGDDVFIQCDIVKSALGDCLELFTNVKAVTKINEHLDKAGLSDVFKLTSIDKNRRHGDRE
ncbi:MAG: hypothetical protein C0483_15260 [Pirellula sp.]|nr:hypothetical protein [Pirellula sp.]